MNRTYITGKLSRDPEFVDRGSFKIVKLAIQDSRNAGKDQQTGQTKWETEFFDVEIQGDSAPVFMQMNAVKGTRVSVEATQKSNKDNAGKTWKHLVATTWEILATKPYDNQQGGQGQYQGQPAYNQNVQPAYAPQPQQSQGPFQPANPFPQQPAPQGPPQQQFTGYGQPQQQAPVYHPAPAAPQGQPGQFYTQAPQAPAPAAPPTTAFPPSQGSGPSPF